MLAVKTLIVVRYAEVDRMGVAHHANYPVWFEAGRTDFFRYLGTSYNKIEENGLLLPLIKLECNFIRPLRYENEVLLQTRLVQFNKVKACFAYELLYQKQVVTHGSTIHVWTNRQLKPVNLSKENPELYQLLVQTGNQ